MRVLPSGLLGFCVALSFAPSANAAPPPPPRSDNTRPPTSPTPPNPEYVEGAQGDPAVEGARTLDEDVAAAWSYSTGGSSEPAYTRPEAKQAAELKINPIGYYQGVSVAGSNLPPFAPQELGTGAAVLTWSGFETERATSRVFFQLSSPIAPEGTLDGLTLTYRLPNTSVNVRNNQRRLDTRYFRTPVTSVSIRRSGADTLITVKLRREVAPQTRVVPGANGYSMFVIEFFDEAAANDVAAADAPES